MQLTLTGLEQDSGPQSRFGRTSQVFSTQRTTLSDALLARFLGKHAHCSQQGENGQTLVVCMAPRAQSHGGFWMPNISAWPNDASVSLLSQALETGSVSNKYCLSEKACAGILHRAVVRNKQLPELLQEVLLSINDDNKSKHQNIKTCETSAFSESSFAQFSQTKTAAPLRASGGANGQGSETIIAHAIAIAGNIIGRKPNYGGNGFGISNNLSHTLTRADRHAVAFQSNAGAGVCMPVCNELSPTQTRNAKHIAVLIQQKKQYILRRLTPVECERLQGFSDNYTLVPYRGNEAKDTPRYSALGNSMAVPVMKWIGHRIAIALSSTP